MDQLAVIIADPSTTDADIEAWTEASMDSPLTATQAKDFFSAMITIINRSNRKLLNVWFNLSLPRFTDNDKAQLFAAIDNGGPVGYLLDDPYFIKLTDITDQGAAAEVTYLLPLLDVRPIDIEAVIDRLSNPAHSNRWFGPMTPITCHTDWTPATGGVSTAPALHGGSHMMSKVSALLSTIIAKYNV
jgi:hypothetical protein